MKLTILQPCHENWDEMSPAEKGKFCAVCSKVVRDFSSCSDAQILSELADSAQNICGNLNLSQLNRPLNYSFANSLFTKFAVGFMLTSVGLVKVSAQKTCEPIKDTVILNQLKGTVSTAPGKVTPVFLRGAVSFKETDEPLYILDRKIITKKEFDKLNPEKLKSVNVLKGATATALYGIKGLNRVIIIETKKNH